MKFYFKINRVLTKLFKESKQERQNESFIFEKTAKQMFQRFIKTFTKIFILIHFDFKNFIKVEIDASEFVTATIIFQFIMLMIDMNQT